MLPSPYSDCVQTENVDTLISREMQRVGFNYSRRNCMVFCQQMQTIDYFGCYDFNLPRMFDAQPCDTYEHFQQLSAFSFNFSKL